MVCMSIVGRMWDVRVGFSMRFWVMILFRVRSLLCFGRSCRSC